MPAINVSVTADVADLTAKMALARQDMQAANAALRDMAAQMRAAGATAGNELKAGLATAAQVSAQVTAEMAQLRVQMREATGGATNSFGQMRAAAVSFGQDLKYALAGGQFLIFKEIAQQALGTIKSLFDDTAGAAMRFALDNAKFSAQLGVSMTEAAGLAMALDDVGASSGEYAAMAMKMTMRLRENEQGFTALGMRTRDAGGELLSGRALMESAIATMQQYKAGTDQNSVALYLFGRGAADIYNLMRVSETSIRENAELLKFFGVATGENAARGAAELQGKLAELKDIFATFAIAIGQRATPSTEEFTRALDGLKEGLREAIDVGTKAIAVFILMSAPIRALMDIQRGDFTGAAGEFTTAWDGALKAFGLRFDEAKQKIKEVVDAARDASSGAGTPGGGLFGSGDKSFDDPAKRKSINMEILDGERAAALQRIKLQEDANNADLAASRANAEQHRTVALMLAEQRLEIERDYLKKKEALDSGDAAALQKDKNKQLAVEMEAAEARQRIDAAASQAAQQMRLVELADESAMANARLAMSLDHLDVQAQMKRISVSQQIAEEKRLTAETFQENLTRLDREIAMLAEGTAAWQRAMAARARLVQQHNAQVQKLDDKAAIEARNSWLSIFQPIDSAFDSMIRGIIQGTTTLRNAMRNMLQSIVLSFAQARLKIELDWLAGQLAMAFGAQDLVNQSVFAWIAGETAKTGATTTGNAIRSASDVAAAGTSKAATLGSAGDEIITHAANAAAAVYDAVSQIPYVGWILAPIAAGVAFAAVVAYKALIPSFDVGSWNIPADTMAMVHAGEMVIPANVATGLRGGQNQGGTPFNASAFAPAGAAFAPRVSITVHNAGKMSSKDINNFQSATVAALRKAHRGFGKMPGGR